MKKLKWAMFVLVAALATWLALVPPQGAQAAADAQDNVGADPRVMPPHSEMYGVTYGEWSARLIDWVLSIPPANHPFFNPDICDVKQSTPVWFMSGTFANVPVTRSCTIPAGMAVFIPLVSWFTDNVAFCPGCTEDEMLAQLDMFMSWTDYSSLGATIDGVDVSDLTAYRVQSPLTDFTVTSANIAGWPIGFTTQLVTDGVYLLLAPLSVGHHVIHIEAEIPATGFDLDMTYDVTVVGGKKPESDSKVGTWSLVKSLYR
jgi:hypothetical protein